MRTSFVVLNLSLIAISKEQLLFRGFVVLDNNDSNSLLNFIIEGKRSTYASSSGNVPSRIPGSIEQVYLCGDFEYRDVYFGARHFLGQEIIRKSEIAVWGMNYKGRTVANDIPVAFFNFLREALAKVDVTKPYRGPDFLEISEWSYRCESSGTWDNFSGEEVVLQHGREFFKLQFHGGTIV